MPYTIAELNQLDQESFVIALGAVFEDTPTIAQLTWSYRPFNDREGLHQAMVRIVQGMTPEAKLALIQAHPDLGSKAKMAEASVKEQAGAGLDRLTPEEFERFHSLNTAYKAKFGFPFIIAVKNHTKASILEAFEERLNHSIEAEQAHALLEINQIANFRLQILVN